MKKCYYCGARVSDEARFCPQCGKPMEITRELVQRAIAGDADAQSELYSRTFQTVYGRIRVKVPDEDTALDLTQDTYLRAFTHLEQLKEPAAFPGWILTIARNLTINWYKKHARDKNVSLFSQSDYENEANLSVQDDEGQEPEYHVESLPEESLDRAETSRLVQEILNSLPEEQRLVLLLRYVEQMSINEIAETLGENPNTVKTRLTLGKKKVEAKVRKLERQGTKLYSLSPLPFLLWLLRNMESDTPTVSSAEMLSRIQTALQTGYTHGNPNAPRSSGSNATGVQGSSSGGGILKQSAGTAAQTAGKGVAMKIAAVAVAVVLVGGGIGVGLGTAIHNATTKEETQTTEAMLEEESTGASETDATEIAPPSAEVIEEMLSLFDQFTAEGIIADFAPGELTASQAIEIAAFAMYETEDTSNYTRISESSQSWAELPTDIHTSYLKNLFGSDYELSDFVDSAYLRQDDSGQLYINEGDFSSWVVSFSVESISETEDESIYTVQACYTMTGYDESNSLDVTHKYIAYQVTADDTSDYGWAIISMTESDGSDTTLTTEELYAAYAEIVTEYENSYGEGGDEIDSVNGYQVTGTFLVQLLDFDGDGQEELLIGVEDPSNRNYTMIHPWVDIWACVDGEVQKVYSPKLLGLEDAHDKNVCYSWDIGLDIIYSELDEKICIIQGFLEDGYNYYEYSDCVCQIKM